MTPSLVDPIMTPPTLMRRAVLRLVYLSVFLSVFLLNALNASAETAQSPEAKAEEVISAFYTFDAEKLAPLLLSAKESAPSLLFYQGWAQGGNYKVLKRHACVKINTEQVACSITVDDDLVLALKREHKVTDTFTFSFADGNIISIETSSDDEPIYRDAFEWTVQTTPALMKEECAGFFEDGPTPAKCARAMAKGFKRFAAQQSAQ